MLGAAMIAFFRTYLQLRFFKCNCFWFWVLYIKFQIISFVVIIRIIRNVIVVGYVFENETIIEILFKCNYDYFEYCCLLIVLY